MSSDVHEVGAPDPHDVLDVPRGADRQQVIRAFRRKVRRGGHPDTGGDARAFEEFVRARDALLEQEQPAADGSERRGTRATPQAGADRQRPDHSPAGATPNGGRRPRNYPNGTASNAYERHDQTPPTETSKLAIVTVALAFLGPLFWPVAIVVGHVALRQIKRTGKGGGTVVPIVLLFLYVITLPILARVLSMMLIP